MVSDGLENAWGSFKASLFYYTGIVLVLLANFVYSVADPVERGGALRRRPSSPSATLFPKMEILLFLHPSGAGALSRHADGRRLLADAPCPSHPAAVLSGGLRQLLHLGRHSRAARHRADDRVRQAEKGASTPRNLRLRGLPHLRRLSRKPTSPIRSWNSASARTARNTAAITCRSEVRLEDLDGGPYPGNRMCEMNHWRMRPVGKIIPTA